MDVSAEGDVVAASARGGTTAGSAVPPRDRLPRMVTGYQLSQALYVVATLGVADLVADAPKTAEELAEKTGCHGPSLYRVLRGLASVGVFVEDDAGRFGLTETAEYLRSGVPGSVRAQAILVNSPSFWSSWGDLLETVRTGETAFPRVHGMSRWEFLAQHPEEGAIFDAAMTAISAGETASIVGAGYDFSAIGVLADVGGGQGELLAAILAAHPSMRGILFDRPHVVAGAGPVLERAGVADRCEVVAGDFFEGVPIEADAYVLKWILHDWADEPAAAILRRCRAAMPDRGKLLLVERILRPANEPDSGKFMDLNMMVMNGGRERTVAEYERLYAEAGFRLTQVIPTGTGMEIVEGVPV